MKELYMRNATEEDAALIADFSRQAFYDTFAADNTPENMDKFLREQFAREDLIKEVTAPGNLFLLVFDDEELAGYACLRTNSSHPLLDTPHVLEIARIYVAANAIGKGIGKMLMQECIQTAIRQKKEMIWLGVWEHNLRAIGFYRQFGFEKFGDTLFMLGDDEQGDWVMRKKLKVEK